MSTVPLELRLEKAADAAPPRGQDRHLLAPPAAQYVRTDDKLIIDYISAGAFAGVTVNYRLMNMQGEIVEFQNNLAIVGDSTAHTLQVNLNEGYLLGVALSGAGAGLILRGQAFFVVSIGRLIGVNAFLRGMTIISDYLCGMSLLAWPGGLLRQATDGPGWIRSQNIGGPGAGFDFSIATPASVRVKLRALFATLTTSAAAGNRVPILNFLIGGLPFMRMQETTIQGVSTVTNYSWTPANTGQGIVSAPNAALAMPPDCTVPPLTQIGPITAALQAADVWSNINILWEQWFDV